MWPEMSEKIRNVSSQKSRGYFQKRKTAKTKCCPVRQGHCIGLNSNEVPGEDPIANQGNRGLGEINILSVGDLRGGIEGVWKEDTGKSC